MKVHVFQHVPFEGLGSIRIWLEERDAQVGYTRFFTNDPLPPVEGVDLLIVMGGPMSVNDEAQLPWLRVEKQAVRDAIANDTAVLGICLGAQLIASAVGSRVYPNPLKEIGWFPIQGVTVREGAFRFPAECTVFHWHGETFDLPAGAVQLAKSGQCANQAFQLKRDVIGLQFHLEMMPDGARALMENCRSELTSGPYIQTEQQLLAIPDARYKEINELMSDVLAHLVERQAHQRL
jgi:GMP synthase-like glutamine amidotransferase